MLLVQSAWHVFRPVSYLIANTVWRPENVDPRSSDFNQLDDFSMELANFSYT